MNNQSLTRFEKQRKTTNTSPHARVFIYLNYLLILFSFISFLVIIYGITSHRKIMSIKESIVDNTLPLLKFKSHVLQMEHALTLAFEKNEGPQQQRLRTQAGKHEAYARELVEEQIFDHSLSTVYHNFLVRLQHRIHNCYSRGHRAVSLQMNGDSSAAMTRSREFKKISSALTHDVNVLVRQKTSRLNTDLEEATRRNTIIVVLSALLCICFIGTGALTSYFRRRFIRHLSLEIAQRKNAQQRSMREAKHLSTTLNSIGDAVIVTDNNGKITRMNPVAESLTGWSMAEAAGLDLSIVFHIVNSYTGKRCRNPVERVMESGEIEGLANHTILVSRNGTQYQISDSGAPIRGNDNAIHGVVLVFRDITEEYRIQAQIEKSEKNHRQVINSMRDAVIIAGGNGKIKFLNNAACDMYGYSEKDAIGMNASTLVSPNSEVSLEKFLENIDNYGHFFGYSTDLKKDGSTFPAEIQGTNIMFDGEKCHLAVVRDISERMRTREQINRLVTAINTTNDSIAITDTQGVFTYVNAGTVSLLGVKDEYALYGKSTFDFISPAQRGRAIAAMNEVSKKGSIVNREFSIESPEHGTIPVEMCVSLLRNDTNTPVGYVAVTRDISEHKKELSHRLKLEQELQKSQKLESLGVLAGGIAHDFNNLLGGIYSYIELAKMKITSSQARDYLQKSTHTMKRAKDLTQQLLTFAKGGEPIKEALHLEQFVKKEVKFAISGSDISCEFDFTPDLWICEYDPNQLGQVLNNITINARQAMSEHGILRIAAKNVHLGEEECAALEPGRYIRMDMDDNGHGIDTAHIDKIFDPFFTTKQHGSGLGLSTCYSIVSRHGGTIEVDSTPGKGTRFTIYLPASSHSSPKRHKTEDAVHTGEGIILIMDDEEAVRDSTAGLCRHFGYETVTTDNAEETLRQFNHLYGRGTHMAAIILDLTIPGDIGGTQIVARIRRKCPACVIFVASGYADDPVMAHPREFGFTASLDKPFEKSRLAALFNRYISGNDASA